MFCAVQELATKKENKNGYPKRLEVCSETQDLLYSNVGTTWKYRFSEERFERPVKKAYKSTVHKVIVKMGKLKQSRLVIWHTKLL